MIKMSDYGSYTPRVGDRVRVRRTPGYHGKVGIVTGVVLDVVSLPGIGEVMDFRADDGFGRVLLATNKQMAEEGRVQTVELLDAV